MRVLMLGWEFPPFISGGLGTACYGLTKALSRQQTQVLFVLPRSVGSDYALHVRLLAPRLAPAVRASGPVPAEGEPAQAYELDVQSPAGSREFANVVFRSVASKLLSPYQVALKRSAEAAAAGGSPTGAEGSAFEAEGLGAPQGILSAAGPGPNYEGDLITETRRYARLCLEVSRGESFDVIHAHDWMTFPAGLAVAAATGKPLVVHVHSTEFDRSGDNIHQQIYDIERRGMHGAIRVIAVSHLTRSIIEHRYGIDPKKVDVVYNGIENGKAPAPTQRSWISRGDRIVLFLGRITMQKGPEYFVAAAKKVLEKVENVKFVMAGTGDKVREIIEMAAAEGIGHKVLFTGFLHGKDVERIFKMADVYVMPSVSEPFGIAPLEAISHNVPVIISKTSGVAEVLTHALKVDFWDTHEIANKIVAVLRHPPLASTLREHADMEVRRLTWEDAARKCRESYDRAAEAMPV
ncbi:MAG: glycosyltransferase [Planctomycetes bacterium]|nr:glycosyltransferase [Planctomycetota bacterium]